MFKKMAIFLTVLTSVISIPSFSDHFYVGGGLGLSLLESETSVTIPSTRRDLGGFGFNGGGILGYNFSFAPRYHLGTEFFINGNTTRNREVVHDTHTRLTVLSRYNWGFRVVPGVQYSPDIEAHAIIGYTRGNFNINDNGVFGIVSQDLECNGYQLGAGLTIPLSCALSLRLDGVYSGYLTRHRDGVVNGMANVYSVKPAAFDTSLMLVYKF